MAHHYDLDVMVEVMQAEEKEMEAAHASAECMNCVYRKWNETLLKHTAGMYKNQNVKNFPPNSCIILVSRGSLEHQKAPL